MTDKTLIIAEKPSVALDLTKVLPGKFKKSKTYFESNKYIVSYAIGHLVSICYPEEIDEKWKSWNLSNLPISPESFPLKSLPGTKSQLNALQKLIRRRDVSEIINACDAGREGELIFQYILKYVWNQSVAKKTIRRLWLQSMTNSAIKEGFNNLKDNADMITLSDAAMCRSESDWLIGINATRAMTGFNSRRGGFFLTPCGRVQTPTLSLIVARENSRREFKPKVFHTLLARFVYDDKSYTGKWIDPKFKKNQSNRHLTKDRIWTKKEVDKIIQKCTGQDATVTESSKRTSQKSPPLYDLTSLQREANSRFGFSAKNTLSIAQALYERHKVLTYPRTDSKHLPEDYIPNVYKILSTQEKWQLGKFASKIVNEKLAKKDKRIFNNKKISDHFAIIPTTKLPSKLSEPESKIYKMVVQRFLAVFFPAAQFLNTKRISKVKSETFLTEGKILEFAGWKAIYQQSSPIADKLLNNIPSNTKILCQEVSPTKNETKPLPPYNEATLLSAMEHCGKLVNDEDLAEAMKERGLGTPATRAAIIEKLLKEKYIARAGKDLNPTGKAFELLSLIEAMHIEVLASPEMTGEWEYKLSQILNGKMTRSAFMLEIRKLSSHIVDQVRDFEKTAKYKQAPFSPINDIVFLDTPTAYIAKDDSISIRKVLGGRLMTDSEIVDILNGKTVGPFADFLSKKGKTFTASIRLKSNKIDFIFANSTDDLDIPSIKRTPSLGRSPIDNTDVFETPASFMSSSALDGDLKQGLQISKMILSKEITRDNIKQLLTDGKTELITGFISKKRRPFDAFLHIDKKGKITFTFPPRKQKKRQ